jgi:site-specific DNA recombinase
MSVHSKNLVVGPAVGYLRCSTTGQANEGVSLETQEAKIKATAITKDLELIGLYRDAGISGASAANRPGLQEALATACKHRCPLIVYSLSRLARSTKDAIAISERLDKAKADLVSVTEAIDTTSAAGRMVFKMLAVLAEFERDTVSERTRAAMGYKRSKGYRISRHVPYGFKASRNGERLTPNVGEQTIVASIRRLRKRGHSLRKIAAGLQRRKVPTKTGGGRWHASTVRGILARV